MHEIDEWSFEPLAPELYQRMLNRREQLDTIGSENLSGPLFATAPKRWFACRRRTVLIGQETYGWGFSEPCPADNRHHHSISTLKDIGQRADAVAKLCDAYVKFDLGKSNSKLERTPFWRMHRLLANRLGDGDYQSVMWLNVVAVDYCAFGASSASMWWNLTYEDVDLVAEWQRGKLTSELKKLKPDCVVFASGPNYDRYLRAEFGELKVSQVDKFDALSLAQMSDRDAVLPSATYRMYHPGYIMRRGIWNNLERFVESLL
jgi:hypothetical protein